MTDAPQGSCGLWGARVSTQKNMNTKTEHSLHPSEKKQSTGMGLDVSAIEFSAASPGDVHTGLLGWVSMIIGDGLVLDGIAVRRTLAGRLALSFPARKDATGRQHAYIRPIDDRTRRDLERQVFQALSLREVPR